jgi:hypothetical protein
MRRRRRSAGGRRLGRGGGVVSRGLREVPESFKRVGWTARIGSWDDRTAVGAVLLMYSAIVRGGHCRSGSSRLKI